MSARISTPVRKKKNGKVYVGRNINTVTHMCLLYVSCAKKKNELQAEEHPSLYVN